MLFCLGGISILCGFGNGVVGVDLYVCLFICDDFFLVVGLLNCRASL